MLATDICFLTPLFTLAEPGARGDDGALGALPSALLSLEARGVPGAVRGRCWGSVTKSLPALAEDVCDGRLGRLAGRASTTMSGLLSSVAALVASVEPELGTVDVESENWPVLGESSTRVRSSSSSSSARTPWSGWTASISSQVHPARRSSSLWRALTNDCVRTCCLAAALAFPSSSPLPVHVPGVVPAAGLHKPPNLDLNVPALPVPAPDAVTGENAVGEVAKDLTDRTSSEANDANESFRIRLENVDLASPPPGPRWVEAPAPSTGDFPLESCRPACSMLTKVVGVEEREVGAERKGEAGWGERERSPRKMSRERAVRSLGREGLTRRGSVLVLAGEGATSLRSGSDRVSEAGVDLRTAGEGTSWLTASGAVATVGVVGRGDPVRRSGAGDSA